MNKVYQFSQCFRKYR